MPVYSCECTDAECGTQLDYQERITHGNSPACPECGCATKRIITSAPAYRLNGVGWARDGYRETQRGIDNESDKAEIASVKRRNKAGRTFS